MPGQPTKIETCIKHLHEQDRVAKNQWMENPELRTTMDKLEKPYDLATIAMDLLGVPQDNTLENDPRSTYMQNNGEFPPGTYCRDYLTWSWLNDTAEEFINKCRQEIGTWAETNNT